MKYLAITAAAAVMLPASAAADVTVMIPRDTTSREQVATYLAELDGAVKKVCLKAVGPLVGVAYYTYRACLKDAAADVVQKDPTGLYALRGQSPGVQVIAAR
jgi:hypothetical protein